MKKDLDYSDEDNFYTFECVLLTLTMIIFPRSMAGLNLNPNEKEKEFQENEIEILLQRVCQKTYLMKSGWEILRTSRRKKEKRPIESTCKYESGKTFFSSDKSLGIFSFSVTLNEKFSFTRPATVTGAYLYPTGELIFHQMTLDRVQNDQYILQNTDLAEHSPGT